MTFEEFILAHQEDDTARLLLSRKQFPEIDVSLAVNTIESRRKLRKKVPEWHAVTALTLPSPLSAEQCSSSATAAYKAALLKRLEGAAGTGAGGASAGAGAEETTAEMAIGATETAIEAAETAAGAAEGARGRLRVADLTGGLGVDSVAFSRVAEEVLYNDMSPELVAAAKKNFALLGARNVRFSCRALEKGALESILDGFRPDVIFLDPARRDASSRKVFRLEDCSPDITVLLDELLAAARHILVKISPMADISILLRTLPNISEIHIVETAGECKELLLLLDRNHPADLNPSIVVARVDNPASFNTLQFNQDEISTAIPRLAGNAGFSAIPSPLSQPISSTTQPAYTTLPAAEKGLRLFEPGKALAKSGAFNLISERYGLTKLDKNTHLYVAEEIPEDLQSFGKTFRILETAPLSRQSLKDFGRKYPRAEVTARNIPMTSEALKARLGCASGGDIHIFGVLAASQKRLIASEQPVA